MTTGTVKVSAETVGFRHNNIRFNPPYLGLPEEEVELLALKVLFRGEEGQKDSAFYVSEFLLPTFK